MSKKYEFVPGDEIVIAPGRTLKRIRALVAIAALGIVPGDTGGYIEKEENLSQVYGNAWVSGDARVYGDAQVYGNARVSGNALVSGDGLIFWASKVGSENGTLTVYACKDGSLEVTRGCFFGSVSKFIEASAAKHDKRTRREYELLIEVAKSRIEAAIGAAQQIQGGE